MGVEATGVDQLLKQQLNEAQLELERLEELVQQVPELMEQRCLQELRQVAHQNDQLLTERQRLLHLLHQDEEQQANAQAQSRLLTLKPLQDWAERKRRLLVVVLASSALALVTALAWQQRLELRSWLPSPPTAQRPQPSRPQPWPVVPVGGDSETIVTLAARDASWLEVFNARTGELLLQDTVNAGDTRRIRLRSGLRLYAARPEALHYSLDDEHFNPWPSAAASGWLELKPSAAAMPRP